MSAAGRRFETVGYDVSAGIATITLDRPERRNAFTLGMGIELLDAFDEVDRDDDVRAVVVTGSGRDFCVGADLDEGFVADPAISPVHREFIERTGTVEGLPRDGGGVLALRIAGCTKPVVAAVRGAAVGVGATMTLPMDVRVAGESTRFGFVFARRGIVPDATASWYLPRIVGIATALEWFVTGRLVSAEEASAARLVTHRVPDEEVEDRARSIAEEIVANTSPVAVAAGRRMLWEAMSMPHPWAAHVLETVAIAELVEGPDVQEGVAAFRERRPAEFRSTSADVPRVVPAWSERPTDGADGSA